MNSCEANGYTKRNEMKIKRHMKWIILLIIVRRNMYKKEVIYSPTYKWHKDWKRKVEFLCAFGVNKTTEHTHTHTRKHRHRHQASGTHEEYFRRCCLFIIIVRWNFDTIYFRVDYYFMPSIIIIIISISQQRSGSPTRHCVLFSSIAVNNGWKEIYTGPQ